MAAVPNAAMAAPPPQPSIPPPLPDAPPPPPPVDNTPMVGVAVASAGVTGGAAPGTYMSAGAPQSGNNPYEQYTAAQYAAMTPVQQYALQQHWQQWQTYQHEYAKWHAQYGEQYKREMAAAAATNTVAPPHVAASAGPIAAPPITSSVPPIGPVYPPAQIGPQMAVQPTQAQPQPYYQQTQMQQLPPQMQPQSQTHSHTQMPGKIMAQPQMYNQPPPPPPQVYQQQQQKQQPLQQLHHQQQQPPTSNQWQQQPPPGRFNQMPPVNYSQPPSSGRCESGMFPNLQQPPPSFMQQPPPATSTSSLSSGTLTDPPWAKGTASRGNDRGNTKDAEDRSRWDGPPPDVGSARNNRWQGNEPGNNNNSSNNNNSTNNNQSVNKSNQSGNRRSWPGNNANNSNSNSRTNAFNTGSSGHFATDDGAGPNSSNFDSDSNSGNFGGPSSVGGRDNTNYGGNFGNNGSGQGPTDNYGPGNNNNRRSGRWEQNRSNQSGGNFGPPQNNNNSFHDAGYNRVPNQSNYSQQQQQQQQQQQELSFDRLFNQWEKQFEDWKRANANHPDRDEYRRYEEEFEKQRRRIAERREQMRRGRQMQNSQQLPPNQQQQPGAIGGDGRYGDYEEGEGYSDEDSNKQTQNHSRNQGPGQRRVQNQRQGQNVEEQNEAPNESDATKSHYDSPKSDAQQEQPQQQTMPLASHEQNIPAKPATQQKQLRPQQQQQEQPKLQQKPQLNAQKPAAANQQQQQLNVDKSTTTATAVTSASPSTSASDPSHEAGAAAPAGTATELGKRKIDAVRSTPLKQSKQENILIISLDDDDDEVDEVQQKEDNYVESSNDARMKNIFKKSDGIPGLDLVADGSTATAGTGSAAASSATMPANQNADNNKKIPSLFDVVIVKPGISPQGQQLEKEKPTGTTVNESLPDTVSNVLKDPEFMNNLSQALAQAQGRELEQQQQQQESNERSDPANNSNKNEGKHGRALSFAEWKNNQKNNQKNSKPDGQQNNMADNAPGGCFGGGPAGNDAGNRGGGFGPGGGGGFGTDQRPPHGFGSNGPPFGPSGDGGGQVMGPNFIDFGGPSCGNFRPNGPNFGGPNFNQQGPGSFGGGPGPNGPFGRNFGPAGPNNPNFNGPGPSYGQHFRGNGPGQGPGPAQFRSNFCGPNGPGPGQNFGGPGPFCGPGGPGGPNAAAPFNRNFGQNNPNEHNFGQGPNSPNERNFGPGPGSGPNNPNFNGSKMGNNNNNKNNNSFSENPFKRKVGPSGPSYDDKPRDGPGFGPRGRGPMNQSKKFGQARNSFGNAGNNDNSNRPWPDSAEHINHTQRPNDPVYRPMQVFDYQNSRNTSAKVIDYGHKSADNAATRVGIGDPGPGPGPDPGLSPGAGPGADPASAVPDFRPGVIFDYGHASHNAQETSGPTGPGAGSMNRNPNSNNKKKNKKKNKNRQRLLQQQQQQQQQEQNLTTLTGNECTAPEQAAGKTDDLEDISDGEDSLTDVARLESPPPPPKFHKQQQPQSPLQQQTVKVFPANPKRRILGDPPTALFPSTAAANEQIPEQIDTRRLEMSVPTNENLNTISIDEVLLPPGRISRPKRICIILRGAPGCGKSYVARLIKDKELEMGGANPRILSIDDYFIIENDYDEKCPKTGKKIPKKEILYEYDDAMEETYMQYLIKSFKKTLSDNLYDFIIVDCNNNSLRTLNEFYCHAKDSNFVPYIIDMHCDVETCLGRNIHQRSEEDIRFVLENWCTTPLHYIKLDVSSLLENVVEMEDVEDMATDDNADSEQATPDEAVTDAAPAAATDDDDDDEDSNSAVTANDCGLLKSKWENDTTEENLARLDGTKRLMQKRKTASIADYLQLDEWEPPSVSADGKKRVRWADIEEKRAQQKMRAIGFVVGQTDWKRMMDPNSGNRALNKTKYIERVNKRR
ncbi:uncharacterized protein DDB_G0283357 [Drosophila grimshawi]|nr:uncharacterized protein DDB_G0283357 [Drosophila grimshawi]